MEKKLTPILVGIFILFVLVSNSIYILDQRVTSLVLQFGQPVKTETEPGLKFIVPFVQNVLFFDKRIQNLAADTTEVIASDQKTMRVDAFTKYKIIDALKFFQAAKDENGFKARLSPILDSSLRQVLGSLPFKVLLTPERANSMLRIREIVNREAKDFGVEIVDVRIMRADLPDRSRDAVYERMKSDREKEAKEIRAEGAEQGQIIKATAEKDRAVIIAEAKKRAEILRGEGDGEAIKAFASAFNRDPEFYDFYRSLQAYKRAFNKDSSKMILSPESEFMKHFKRG